MERRWNAWKYHHGLLGWYPRRHSHATATEEVHPRLPLAALATTPHGQKLHFKHLAISGAPRRLFSGEHGEIFSESESWDQFCVHDMLRTSIGPIADSKIVNHNPCRRSRWVDLGSPVAGAVSARVKFPILRASLTNKCWVHGNSDISHTRNGSMTTPWWQMSTTLHNSSLNICAAVKTQ